MVKIVAAVMIINILGVVVVFRGIVRAMFTFIVTTILQHRVLN